MKLNGVLLTAAGCLGAIVVLGQAPAPAPQTGPGVQALQDAKYADWIMTKCKVPPQRGGGGGAGRGAAAAPARGEAPRGEAARGNARGNARGPLEPRDYTVKEIPGVIAAGQKWKSVWTGMGNNADGIIATKDGGILAAQNTNSDVMKIDKDDKVSFPYKDTNTGGAVSMNKKGAMFLVSRGLPQKILQLEPKRRVFADMYNGEPLDCAGGLVNDLSAASNGGVYFTMGSLYYANPQGVITKQGTVTGTNGIILSGDEKTLYVTGRIASSPAAPAPGTPAAPGTGGSIIAYDVKPDGSLANERQFATVGGDGTTIDSMGRLYSTGGGGIQVIAPDGKFLGEIPAPVSNGLITAAFSGPDKKTLYAVANNQVYDEIFKIQMISQGFKGRAK
jgi:sugar lactone lactonase YvrE